MSSQTPLPSETYFKPLASAGVAILSDRVVLKETNMKKNLTFGLSVGAGIGIGSMVAKNLPIPDSPSLFGNGKQIASRLLEITSGAGANYAVNRFIMKNDSGAGMIRKMSVIVARKAKMMKKVSTDYKNRQMYT